MPIPDPTFATRRVPRIAHTMLRVDDLDRALRFYLGTLGMTLFRRDDVEDGRFTLAFVGYDPAATIELTHNWDPRPCEHGNRFGHVAIAVRDVVATCASFAARGAEVIRPPGPMRGGTEVLAFLRDADGYWIELVEEAT